MMLCNGRTILRVVERDGMEECMYCYEHVQENGCAASTARRATKDPTKLDPGPSYHVGLERLSRQYFVRLPQGAYLRQAL
jgi:hypothetical protein